MPPVPEIVAAVAQRLAEYAGLDLPAWVVEARLAARLEATELAADDYVALVRGGRGAAELDELVEAVRVGETRLFRHRSQVAALRDTIVPALRGKRAIRVWSAGCAAGEEPYTLAAVLARGLPGCAISIIATDVSADAIEVARRAAYPASALADVPDDYRDAFVRAPDGDRIGVRADLAGLVRFERANLIDGFAPRNCDLVWCRNVLIYFTPAARKRALERVVAATNPGGTVFVGYSESLRDMAELEAVRCGDAVYYVRREPDALPVRPSPSKSLTPAAGVLVVHGVPHTPLQGLPAVVDAELTPPPALIPAEPPPEDVLVLRGHPDARAVTAELTARLALAGLRTLVVDLDRVELLGDDLAPVFRRARAAARAAGVRLELRTSRAGARRWLGRHGFDPESQP